MCGPKGCGFLAVLVRSRVRIRSLILNWARFFRKSYFFVIIDNEINKSPSQCLNIGL